LTEKDINKDDPNNNKLIFSGSGYPIDTTREFAIKYSYVGENNKRHDNLEVTVGKFVIQFVNPSIKALESDLGSSTSYGRYNGQTEKITSIKVEIDSLNSVDANPYENKRNITKLELYKNNELVDTTADVSKSYTFNRTDEIKTNTIYSIKAYFEKRTGTSTT
jgi:hypothetical protein